MEDTKAKRRAFTVKEIKDLREAGSTYNEIALYFNEISGLKTMTGEKWTTRNLFNFYNRHK